MNIILLTGNACSGKSFVAGLIEEKHEYKIRRLDFDFTDPDLDRQKVRIPENQFSHSSLGVTYREDQSNCTGCPETLV